MKKISYFILICFLLLSCTTQSDEEKQLTLYEQFKNQLISQNHFDTEYPFDVSLLYSQLEEGGYRYDVVIDNVKCDLYDIEAMAYTDENEQEMCPTIGLFDEDDYNLKVNFIDKANGFYKGVQLSGTTKKKQSSKVYISYYTEQNKQAKIEKYIEVNE